MTILSHLLVGLRRNCRGRNEDTELAMPNSGDETGYIVNANRCRGRAI